jgi:hypothetical protein
MENLLSKYGKWIAAALGAVGTLLSLLIFTAGNTTPEEKAALDGAVGNALLFAYIVGLVGALAAIGSSIRGLMINPQGIRSAAVGVGALLLVFVLSYLTADGSDFEQYKNITENGSKWVSTGLNAFYIMMLLSVGAVVFSLVYRSGMIKTSK